ncbi:MAG: hypothetical protein GX352_01565, partial [Clostridiales bacterium]|nr:hypothetical protein [Clostridiales bacterium]
MLRKIVRIILTLIGITIGITLAWFTAPRLAARGIQLIGYQDIIIYFLFGIIFGVLFLILSNKMISYSVSFIRMVERKLQEVPASDILFGVFGLIIGLFIAYLVSFPLRQISLGGLALVLTTLVYLFFGYLGISIATKRWREFEWPNLLKKIQRDKHSQE